MFLGKRIKELREEKGLLQCQLAAELEIDSPMFRKIERGERLAKREQTTKLAKLFQEDENELLTLWLTGQIYEIIKDEKVAPKAIEYISSKVTL